MPIRFLPSCAIAAAALLCASLACRSDKPTETVEAPPTCDCGLSVSARVDAYTPQAVVPDWGPPVRVGSPVNSPCPADAIEISRDGGTLFFLFTRDLLQNLSGADYFDRRNATYKAVRTGGPGDFGQPVFYDLGKGANESLNAELSFTPDGSKVYFHSLRSANTGYQQNPPVDDFLDIYVADIVDGEPGPGRNLGAPVNSVYPDGEEAIHPDGVTLYFTSPRPGGIGQNDIWTSTVSGGVWSQPRNLGRPVDSAGNDLQPAFTADGDTMYFSSDRDAGIGMAIYRSVRNGQAWGEPELVLRGMVGEPSITGDGRLLYFVHVLTDGAGVFDSDVWYTARRP